MSIRYKILTKNEANKPIKALQIYCGRGNNSYEFTSFCETYGIKREFIVAYISLTKIVFVKEKIALLI